ncbi:DUF1116 domain-containing protein [Streptomyces sp. SID8379]|uniref:DUF1116 domain-containing protein n=1 Tax=unclassified Streptomyces TaxID=2593676 RepID=UPI00036B4EC0|nr:MULTISPECIES: DUF1116 domain-containing protein [unclassified Streptomyces]MYW64971.1 DUF1116 domain-containing protein [Streptomyces sp. SID8379]
MTSSVRPLLAAPPHVVNVGVDEFAAAPRAAGATVTQVDWRPPAAGDERLAAKLARLTARPDIETANATALARVLDVQPLWTDVRPAGELIPELAEERLLLHAGPPIAWERMCGPMRAAVVGAALLEGWAATEEEATRLADSGGIRFAPCHHHDAVGPMAGIVSASMPLMVVEDRATGLRAYSNLNEGQGRCLRYGALGDDVMRRLRWMGERLGPALRAALRSLPDPVNLRAVTAQALQMGDECHSRNTAASALLTRELAAALARHADLGGIEALDFLRDNNYWFLNFSMAASKLALMAGHGVPGSTLVTAFARNGVDVGIRVSGLGDAWFTAPAAPVDGLYFAGYGPDDANPDIGDSAITETHGLGGFALAAAPAIVGFVGGTPARARRISEEMATITLGRHRDYRLSGLDFAGSPVGIDVRKVVDTGLEPVVTTGIAHREPGIGQIGAGLTHAPMSCFTGALDAFPE